MWTENGLQFNCASRVLNLRPLGAACSSQCNQKTDLMEETRQYIYTSTFYTSMLYPLPRVRDTVMSGVCQSQNLFL